MILLDDQKSDNEPPHRRPAQITDDLPPAYDALPLHSSLGRRTNQHQHTNSSPFPRPIACPEPTSGLAGPANHERPVLKVSKSSPQSYAVDDASPFPKSIRSALSLPRVRKNASWLSLLPFVSSFSSKRVRQSVISVVTDLVARPARSNGGELEDVHEIFASIAETCAEHKVSLCVTLQELSIADHTPIYWAIVNYREELLVALLVHSQPLFPPTISDIRRACLVSSNQALFHALRVCRPPFHRTGGLQVASLRTTSDNLLLGGRPLDEVCVQQSTDQAFVVSFEIPLWEKRMKAIGLVGVEFIASGRMWSIIFFSTDPSAPHGASARQRKGANSWHVMVNLLESSPATFFDSRIVIDLPTPVAPKESRNWKIRQTRSTVFPPQNSSSVYGYAYGCDAKASSSPGFFEKAKSPSSSSRNVPPPTHPLRGQPSSPRLGNTSTSPIIIHLGAGARKLAHRVVSGDPFKLEDIATTKPDTWSDHGVGYTNAVVSSLSASEGIASPLLFGNSRYLSPDGTLRGRLEARFVKAESSKECIIC